MFIKKEGKYQITISHYPIAANVQPLNYRAIFIMACLQMTFDYKKINKINSHIHIKILSASVLIAPS